MVKAIGVVTIVAAVVVALGVSTGVISVSGDAKLTQKGQVQVKELRHKAADVVRGK